MAIEATLDNLVQSGKGYVAYVQISRDGKVIETMDVNYNPADENEFKEKIGQRILSLENSLTVVKEKAALTLALVVSEKAVEVADMQAQQEPMEDIKP